MSAERNRRVAIEREPYSDGSRFYYRERPSRSTGTTVVVGHGFDVGLDYETDGPWYTICDDHGYLCSHPTLRLASSFAADPTVWCDECRTLAAEQNGAKR